VGPPADEHGAGGRHDLRELLLNRCYEVEDPVHRVAGTGGEPVDRHRSVHDHLAAPRVRVAHRAPPKNLRGCHPRRSDDVTGARMSSALWVTCERRWVTAVSCCVWRGALPATPVWFVAGYARRVTSLPVRYRSEEEDSARWIGFPFREGDIVI